jgi:hypothetical protein
MKDNPEMYKAFISARPGGGVRQAPKRKRAGATSTISDTALPTQEQLDLSWNNYIAHISKKGSYGDHVEVQAFARAYDADVKIYDRQGCSYHKAAEESTWGTRSIMHIARHVSTPLSSKINVLISRRTMNITLPFAKSMALSRPMFTRLLEHWNPDNLTPLPPMFSDVSIHWNLVTKRRRRSEAPINANNVVQ